MTTRSCVVLCIASVLAGLVCGLILYVFGMIFSAMIFSRSCLRRVTRRR